ncbi:helix-turn-helix transcriptional regulator [Govanella unica]|uniref:LuxR C-terminal-related transcriptional regulator n=1 Tax=Govanella unica TaxID=2975056 RepID=A0A9X3TYN7_9PROT|nr:LuxR C-terminal-related transcriptional regulator [Govania unica]MDA5194218.1 LuxR C-terminal-related transcriptional regulator [Govania unica]
MAWRSDLYEWNIHPPFAQTKGLLRARLLKLPREPEHIILVTAPAGYGKTTFMVQHYLAFKSAGYDVGWLSLDEPLRDGGDFASCLAYVSENATRQQTTPPRATTLGQNTSGKDILKTVLSPHAPVKRPLILYLDDFHLAESDETLALLNHVLETLPKHVFVVMASRTRPKLPLARLMSKGRLREITSQQLAFTNDEARSFLNNSIALDIAETLITRTEGWPAGLQLCRFMFELDSEDDAHAPHKRIIDMTRINGRLNGIADYLAEQVFESLDTTKQAFLLKTSVLDQISGDLANAITGRADGWQTLDWLKTHNLFLFSVDSEKSWFRYHHLFREFLLDRLRRHNPVMESDIHAVAARWLVDNRHYRDALRHAYATRDLAFLEQIAMECGGWRLTLDAGISIWRPLEDAMRNALDFYPTLQLARAHYLLHHGQIEHARYIFTILQDQLPQISGMDPAQTRVFIEIDCAITDLLISMLEDKFWSPERLNSLERRLESEPALDPRLRALAYDLLCWLYYWAGDFRQGAASGHIAARRSANMEAAFIEAYSHMGRGASLLAMARLDEALSSFDHAYHSASAAFGPNSAQAILPNVCKADVLLEWGRIDAAWELVAPIFDIIDNSVIWVDLVFTVYKVASVHRLQHYGLDSALSILEDGLALFSERMLPRLTSMLSLQMIDLMLWHGDVDRAQRKAETLGLLRLSNDSDPSLPERWLVAVPTLAVMARLSLELGDMDKARSLTIQFGKLVEEIGARRYQMEFHLLSASIACQSQDMAETKSEMKKAQEISAVTGQHIQYAMMKRLISPEILSSFHAQDGGPQEQPYVKKCIIPQPVILDSEISLLSPREVEAFVMLRDGLTSKEIARRMDISVNTAMGYRKSIYRKLNISSRSAIVAVARSL